MKYVWFLLLILVLPINCIFGQKKIPVTVPSKSTSNELTQEKIQQKQREIDIQYLIQEAKVMSLPEASADILLSLAESNLVSNLTKKKEIVGDAFQQAELITAKLKRKKREGIIDTRSGYLSMSYELNLDALSLQLRAVNLMLGLDKKKAYDLFKQIPQMELLPLTCEDNLDYQISEFYQVLGKVAEQSFDRKAKKKLEHIYFVNNYIEQINSPAQISPVVKLLTKLQTTSTEYSILHQTFTLKLNSLSSNPRSFNFAFYHDNITGQIYDLMKKNLEKGISSKDLLQAFRKFLMNNLSGAQCADKLDVTAKANQKKKTLKFIEENFGVTLSEEDLKPEKIEPSGKLDLYWQSSKAKELFSKLKQLQFGDTKKDLTDAEKSSAEWQQKLLTFLNDVNMWSFADAESELDYFHQRCAIYRALLKTIPIGSNYNNVVEEFLSYLRNSSIERKSYAEWFLYADILIKQYKPEKLQSAELNKILEMSANPTMQLYMKLNKLKQKS